MVHIISEKEAQLQQKMLEKQQEEMLNKSQIKTITSKTLNLLIKVKQKRKVQAPESKK